MSDASASAAAAVPVDPSAVAGAATSAPTAVPSRDPRRRTAKGDDDDSGDDFDSVLAKAVRTAAVAAATAAAREVAKAFQAASKPADSQFCEYMARQELRKTFPYLLVQDKYDTQDRANEGLTIDAVRVDFEAEAKAHRISPADTMVAMYMLYGDEHERLLFVHRMLHQGMAERVAGHNWLVARRAGGDFVRGHGAAIASLQWPLFPPTAAFQQLNAELLFPACEQPSGGEGVTIPPVYRRPRADEIVGAGYVAPHVTGPNGQIGTDLSVVESQFGQLLERIAAHERVTVDLQRRVSAMPAAAAPAARSRGGASAAAATFANGNAAAAKADVSPQQLIAALQSFVATGGRGRGGGGGGRGGRGRNPRGGEGESGAAATATAANSAASPASDF